MFIVYITIHKIQSSLQARSIYNFHSCFWYFQWAVHPRSSVWLCLYVLGSEICFVYRMRWQCFRFKSFWMRSLINLNFVTVLTVQKLFTKSETNQMIPKLRIVFVVVEKILWYNLCTMYKVEMYSVRWRRKIIWYPAAFRNYSRLNIWIVWDIQEL